MLISASLSDDAGGPFNDPHDNRDKAQPSLERLVARQTPLESSLEDESFTNTT